MSEMTRAEHLPDWEFEAKTAPEAYLQQELRRLSAVEARCAELENLVARLRQEAQIHAQEARTANSAIAEIYQCVTGKTGEPGNWNGAEPVRAFIARQSELLQQAKEALERVCTHETRTSTQIYADWDNARATLSAINEWKKSNG